MNQEEIKDILEDHNISSAAKKALMTDPNDFSEDHPSTASWWIHPPGTPESDAALAEWAALTEQEQQDASDHLDYMTRKCEELFGDNIK